jgi:hypothetical protein
MEAFNAEFDAVYFPDLFSHGPIFTVRLIDVRPNMLSDVASSLLGKPLRSARPGFGSLFFPGSRRRVRYKRT